MATQQISPTTQLSREIIADHPGFTEVEIIDQLESGATRSPVLLTIHRRINKLTPEQLGCVISHGDPCNFRRVGVRSSDKRNSHPMTVLHKMAVIVVKRRIITICRGRLNSAMDDMSFLDA